MSLTFMVAVALLAISSFIYITQYTSTIVPQDLGQQVVVALLGNDSLRSSSNSRLTSISTDNSYSTPELHGSGDTSNSSFSSSTHILNRSGTTASFPASNLSRQVRVPPMPRIPPIVFRHGNLSLMSGAASHISTRDANGSWTPPAVTLRTLPSIDKSLFPSGHDRSDGDSPTHKYLGFVRMTKTGSTSMLNFFNRATRLQTLDKYIRLEELRSILAAAPPAAMKTVFLTPPCMFGFHLAPDQSIVNKTLPAAGYQCQHLSYHFLVTQFTKMLDLYRLNTTEPIRVSLDMTTVVRDPVDRYLSYFHYWRSIYPAWNSTAKPGEREALVSGDFEGFLRHIAEHPQRGLNSAFQYEYLSQNVDYSIDLVNDRRVLPLVNECFNASVLLLTDLYPKFFAVNETLQFLQTAASLTNSRKVAPGPNILSRKGLEPVKEFDLDVVKATARQWLERDYRFYGASIAMFVRHLQASAVDRDEVQRCTQRLSAEAAMHRFRLVNNNLASHDVD